MTAFSGGCQSIGPLSIEEGRSRYNEAIQQTSGDQVLANIARVYLNETPLSLEVQQIVSGTTATASFGEMLTGLGIGKKSGAFRMGSLTYGALSPTLSYSEQPSVTYQPISGDALAQEFTTPVSVTLIEKLYGSTWPILSLLEMTTSELTEADDDYGAALNAIAALDNLKSLQIAAANSNDGPAGPSTTGSAAKPTDPTADADMLVLYFVPPKNCDDKRDAVVFWKRLLKLYPKDPPVIAHSSTLLRGSDQTLTSCHEIDGEIDAMIGKIELNTKPRRSVGGANTVQNLARSRKQLVTYSAYGILKSVNDSVYTPAELIQVVDQTLFGEILGQQANNTGQQWYTLLTKQVCSKETAHCAILTKDGHLDIGTGWAEEGSINRKVDDLILASPKLNSAPDLYTADGSSKVENNLNERRRLILVQYAKEPPDRPFRITYKNGMYFFIGQKDYISQKNLALLQLLISIQSISRNSPPQQSINVGAH